MKVWSVCVPEYDNYDFDLYATRAAAVSAIRAQVGADVGQWAETFDGTQIEFLAAHGVRRRIWSLEEVEVHE